MDKPPFHSVSIGAAKKATGQAVAKAQTDITPTSRYLWTSAVFRQAPNSSPQPIAATQLHIST
jgi:hypothetical protein